MKKKKRLPVSHNGIVIGYIHKLNKKTGVATIKIYDTPEGKSVTESIKQECKEPQITSQENSIINSIIKGKIF